ncbi:hypothetical protein V2H43_10940, partial [Pasteurella multocida]|nr:hypothetical protein [Pasteurella multocida]
TLAGELVGDVACVGQRAREAIQFRDDKGVALATGGECLTQTGPCPIRPGQAVVDVDVSLVDAKVDECLALGCEVLRAG